MNYKPVLTKRDFVKRYSEGEFGNAAPTWNTLDEFLASDYKGLVHLRNRIAGGPTIYNVAAKDVARELFYVTESGIEKACNIYFSGMAPTPLTLIQGEVMLTASGLYFYYSTVAKPMRDALKEEAKEAVGLTAVILLRRNLCPNSYEWLQELLVRYPDHVVEVSAYDVKWGTLAPRFNTCFWEVRKY